MTPYKPGLLAIWMMVALGILSSNLTPMAPAQAQPIMRVEAGQAKQFISDLGAQAITVLRHVMRCFLPEAIITVMAITGGQESI